MSRLSLSDVEREKLGRRIAYMVHGPGRPARHHFEGEGDSVVAEWREQVKRLRERMRAL